MGAEAEDIQGQGTWTTKRVQDGTPLSTPSALAYVVGEHGQGKGCLNLPPLTVTAGRSGVELQGQTLSLRQRVWGCQESANLEPLITAPASADPCEQPWQGKGSSTVSSRTCRVSVPTSSLPACSLQCTSHPGHARSLLAPKSWAVGVSLPGVLQSTPVPTLPLLPAPILTASPWKLAVPRRWLCSLFPLLPSFIPGQVPLSL